jgi:hypothetical protein
MPALDLHRGWHTFRVVEDDAWRVTICADNSRFWMRIWLFASPDGFTTIEIRYSAPTRQSFEPSFFPATGELRPNWQNCVPCEVVRHTGAGAKRRMDHSQWK